MEQHFGEWSRASAAFVMSGVLHFWSVSEPWADRLDEDRDRLVEQAQQRASEEQARELAELTRSLAHHPDFATAKNEAQRLRVLTAILPDASTWYRSDQQEFLASAKAIFDVDVAPRLEEALAADAWGVIRGGASKPEAARRLGIGEDRLRRLLIAHPE